MEIQWYPGHMAKSIRMMEGQVALVDIVIELLDARAPRSAKNPDIDRLARNKKRLLVLNKSDLADPAITAKWVARFESSGFRAITADSLSGKGLGRITDICLELMAERVEREKRRGRIFVPVRAMIAGVPNVGKSTLINRYVGQSAAKTGDKPGVTRGRQWIRVKRGFELLDTPGLLWPKFGDPEAGAHLAITGAISDDVTDAAELAMKLVERLEALYPAALKGRYNLPGDAPKSALGILEAVSKSRRYEKKEGEPDLGRAASAIIGDFRAGRLGRVSLESPDDWDGGVNIGEEA